jgi:glycosyltransferase involved in cell wall biosynthesis
MNLILKAFKTLFTEGPLPFIKKTVNFVKKLIYGVPAQVNPGIYNFTLDFSRPTVDKKTLDIRFRSENKNRMVINWIIPDMGVGSGGHMTIFRMVGALEQTGHKNRIYVFGGTKHGSSRKLKKFINDNFQKLEAEIFNNINNVKDSDALIATSWQTAYPVRAIQNTRKKFYFVQDFEPWFYPMGSEYKMAENTYKFGFSGICAGPWLAKITKEYGMQSDYFDLAYDPQIYHPQEVNLPLTLRSKDEHGSVKKIILPKIERTKLLCYAQPIKGRRCFELMIQGLRELEMRDADFDLSFVGWDLTPYIIPLEEYRNLRILNHEELARVYNWADLAVVFSATNYSLLPHEMMACKLPVLEMKSETTETVFRDDENIVLTEPDPIAIADKLEWLINNPGERKKLADNAYKYVQQFSWEKSGKKVEEILKRELSDM